MAGHIDADVAIVGAGLAGLAAAEGLRTAGMSVVVLEARDRVGGRLFGGTLGGGVEVDLGGQWIGAGHERLAALARELGIATFPTYDDGRHVLAAGGVHREYTGTIPRVSPLVLLDLLFARRRIDRLAKAVSPEAPWAAPGAEALDAQTFETWMRRHVRTSMGRRLLTLTGRTVWGTEPAELSALHVLFYVACAGGIDRLVDIEDGAQQDRFAPTAHGVAAALAARLGDIVRLGEPVHAIEQSPDAVDVIARTARVRAPHVIVAIPPALTARMAFAPELPGLRRQLAQRMPLGTLTKCQVLYERPFWRERGLSGAAVTDIGPVSLTFDSSPNDASAGVLTGFVGGNDARLFARLGADERRDAVLGGLAGLFGEHAAAPLDYAEQAWADEAWSGGGPTSNFGPGGWTGYGPVLREPVGRVHWAGTETATEWSGYMEGALQSGQCAVAEALSASR